MPPPPPPPPPGGYPTAPPPYGPPPPRRRKTGLIVALSVVGAVVLGLIIVGVVTGLPEDAERDDAGQITEAGNLSAFDLEVGDCFDLPDPEGEVQDVGGVPCGDPHDAEVYGAFDLDGDDFPGNREVVREAQKGCKTMFQEFVGLAYQQSVLELISLYPTERSWTTRDDREVVCVITEPKGKITVETLEGANR